MPSDRYFMNIARAVAEGSKDPSTKVGAVLVSSLGYILSTGFNGFPPQIVDDERLDFRQTKYPRVVHAEANALLQAGIERAVGSHLYVYGLPPCSSCAPLIAACRLAAVIFQLDPVKSATRDKWLESSGLSAEIFSEAGIKFLMMDHANALDVL